jgi:hypothetical protein
MRQASGAEGETAGLNFPGKNVENNRVSRKRYVVAEK